MRIALVLALLWPGVGLAQDLLIAPVKLLDTSHEAQDQSADHARRLALMGAVLAEALPGRPLTPETVAAACPTETADCLFRLMTAEEQQRLFENTARAIDGASQTSIERHIEHCTKADPAYGEGVRKAIEALQASKISAVDPNSDAI